MYVKIENEELKAWCKKPYLDYEFVDIEYSKFNPNDYKVINGILTDITHTQEYINQQMEIEKEINKIELQKKLDELDIKRIRAIAEPTLKNPELGETWLEYYNSQISSIREQLLKFQ